MAVLSRLMSKMILVTPRLLDWLVKLRMPSRAAGLMKGKFDKLAPLDQRIVRNQNFRKWDASSASRFLLKCRRPVTIATIFNQWHTENSTFEKKPPIVMNIWLKRADMSEADMNTVIEVATLIMRTNKPLFIETLKRMEAPMTVTLLKKLRRKGVSRNLEELPPEATAHLFDLLRAEDPERYEEMFDRLSVEYAAQVDDKMGERERGSFDKLLGKLSEDYGDGLEEKLRKFLEQEERSEEQENAQ